LKKSSNGTVGKAKKPIKPHIRNNPKKIGGMKSKTIPISHLP
jgi:hypothetical protein